MSQENKAIHRRILEEIWTKGDLSRVDEFVSPDYVNHSDNIPGLEGYKQWVMLYRTAFPDLQFTINDQIAEGDKVMTRWIVRGTHQGNLLGIPPTGKKVEVSGMYSLRFAGGKVVEEWGNMDALGLMRQLGVIPGP